MTDPSPRPRRWRRWLLSVLVLLAIVLVVRALVLDVYLVVEQSMWPTFRGGTDRIVVDKLDRAPRRWQVWVYRAEERGERPSVKRVAGLEGEYVDFRLGDLWTGESPTKMTRETPPAEVIDELLVPVYPTPWGASGAERFSVRPAAEHLRCDGDVLHLDATRTDLEVRVSLISGRGTTRENIHDDAVDNDGEWTPGRHPVPDVRIDVEITKVDGGGTLLIEHDLEGTAGDRYLSLGLGRLRLLRGADGRSSYRDLRWDGAFPLALRMETIDGQLRVARLEAGTGRIVEVLLEEPRDTAMHHGYSRVRFGLDRGTATLRDLDVRRDVYWTWPTEPWQGGPYHVDDGVFMVGDNPGVSEDSRHHGPVILDRMVGRARLVIWPWERSRSLP